MYPLKLNIYLEKDISTVETPTPVKILYAPSSQTIEDALFDLYQALQVNRESCRIWIRKEKLDGGNSENENAAAENDNSYRKLTPDITDVDGDWRYLRTISNQTLEELNLKTISVMVEQKVTDSSTQKSYWPKDAVLNEWKHNLRRGDMCDARDDCSNWYESVISSVNVHSKTVTIHFKGWAKKFDRDLSENELNSELAPLYTRTKNWRDNLKIHDLVDFTKNSEYDASRKWLSAYVMAIDNVNGQLKLKYREDNGVVSEVDKIDLYGENILVPCTATA